MKGNKTMNVKCKEECCLFYNAGSCGRSEITISKAIGCWGYTVLQTAELEFLKMKFGCVAEADTGTENDKKKETDNSGIKAATKGELFELYVNQNMKASDIAKKYSCDTKAVYNRLRNLNISRVNEAAKSEVKAGKYKIDSYCGGEILGSIECDKADEAGAFYDTELRKGNSPRLYIDGERKSISEAEKIFKKYISPKSFSI